MEIDFHYDVVYVLARHAGFSREEAKVIAYSSQYVDDAVHGGFIRFTNCPAYYHIRTAHKVFDRDNFDEMANLFSWVPFHFLPGGITDKDAADDKRFVSRLICREDSRLAREMMEECISRKNDYNGLHRLGLSLHVYADTWAHQSFAGILDSINLARNIDIVSPKTGILEKASLKVKNVILSVDNNLIDEFLPLGHGAVNNYPDIPYVKWRYTDYYGRRSNTIDNSDRFIRAAREVFKYMKRYQVKDAKAVTAQLPVEVERKIMELFKKIEGDFRKRHEEWQNKIKEGYFGFIDKGAPDISYIIDSWRTIALDKDKAKPADDDIYRANESFPDSDWKKFHDAVKQHWDFVVNKLLPKYGVIL